MAIIPRGKNTKRFTDREYDSPASGAHRAGLLTSIRIIIMGAFVSLALPCVGRYSPAHFGIYYKSARFKPTPSVSRKLLLPRHRCRE